MEGVRYMHDSGEDLPMRQLIDIPSCVPAVPGLENAGADFLAEQIEELCGLKRVIGLAEVMDFLAVIHGEDRMMDILKVAEDRGLYMQGHAPYVSGRMLSAYLCGGPIPVMKHGHRMRAWKAAQCNVCGCQRQLHHKECKGYLGGC